MDFSVKENKGYISGDDGKRYQFDGSEWKENDMPRRGCRLDFDINDFGYAVAVFLGLDQGQNFQDDSGSLSSQIRFQEQYETKKNYSMFDWFGKCWRNYVNFEGRARRKEFWSFQLCYFSINGIGVILFLLVMADEMSDLNNIGGFNDIGFMGFLVLAFSVVDIIFFIPNIAVAVRRLHDINLSGWWLLLHFIPVGVCAIWVMFCIDTKKETNVWGPPAKPV